jgi:2-keto-4-pentenoate hydratase
MSSRTTGTDAVREAARRLLEAADSGTPCAPIRDLIGTHDVAAAYAVQRRLTRARLESGARIVGRKIGLTSPAVQRQIGVDQPDFGVLFDDMDVSDSAVVSVERLLQPRVEPEIAFVLAGDLDGDLSQGRVRQAVAYAVAALEIVDSRVAGWDVTLADTIADNASSGLFVLGREPVRLDAFEPAGTVVEMRVDGDVVSRGTGADCMGDPLRALTWLARTAARFGDPLRAGQVILSGALGPMAAVTPGIRVEAVMSGLGRVATRIAEGGAP